MTKIVIANKTTKQAMAEWEEFLASIRDSTPVDLNETPEEKEARMKRLEKKGNEEEWFAYYFPKYAFAKPAPFHTKSSRAFLYTHRIYQRRAWARGLAKSTRRMMEIFYLKFALKWRINMLLISKSESNAIRLLAPYRANLEGNQRLIADYGYQKRSGKWKEEEFITRDKCAFRAVGIEQNPRGAKIEEMRPNMLGFDDADDDEVCANEERLDKAWNWIERAVLPTVDISSDYRIFFDNNIIAEDALAVRAGLKATHPELINIRDENGGSVWPQKNSDQDIADIEKAISYESFQAEYMNNPMSNGKSFPEVTYGKCPPLRKIPFVVQYSDPATSNKDKPSVKSKAFNSGKFIVLIGYKEYKYYVYKVFGDNVGNSTFVDWHYAMRRWVNGQTTIKPYIENNTLQDPFFQQVIKPLLRDRAKALGENMVSLIPDTRDKPDKWVRIEGTLEPLNRNGQLIFNVDEKEDPHMKRLIAQLKAAKATSKILDGPDALEGAVHICKQKVTEMAAGKIESFIPEHGKRF